MKTILPLLLLSGLFTVGKVTTQFTPVFGTYPKQVNWYDWSATKWTPGKTVYYIFREGYTMTSFSFLVRNQLCVF